jgi:hypothetical protein
VPQVKRASLLLTAPWLLAGCPPAHWVENPAQVASVAAGGCSYTRAHLCSSERACEPPQPLPADCPPELRAGPTDDHDDWRPSSRQGWVRVRERLVVTEAACGYYSDFYCPPPSHPARTECDSPEFRQVACALTAAGARVVPFVVRRLSSQCVRYPALDCARGECTLPRAERVACR